MPDKLWRPASEAEAVGTPAVFIEWLRAVHGVALNGPAGLARWRRDEPARSAAAIAEFAGVDALADTAAGGSAAVRTALLQGCGARAALIVVAPDHTSRTWRRAELLRLGELPQPAQTMIARLAPADLPALAASHLLAADTKPDSRLFWSGAPDDPWPLGAWLVDATVILPASAEAAIHAAEFGAAPVTAGPNWRG